MSKVVDFDQLYPNRFMKAGEFQGKNVTLTITDVLVEELEGERGKKGKGIVLFKETPKQLVLNRTNGECLKAMFGRNVQAWIGKRVTFFPKSIEDSFTGETIPAVRVRGSPDIDGDKTFSAKIGRKMVSMKVERTGKPAGRPAALAQAAPLALSPEPPPPPAEPPPVDEEEAASILAAENAQAEVAP